MLLGVPKPQALHCLQHHSQRAPLPFELVCQQRRSRCAGLAAAAVAAVAP